MARPAARARLSIIDAAENALGLPAKNFRLPFAICLSRWLNLDFRILAVASSASWASGVKQAANVLAVATSLAVVFAASLAVAEVANATMTAE